MQQLEQLVRRMNEESWTHNRRPSFTLGDATPIIASNHLLEEAVELQVELINGDRERAISELADVLGILMHLCVMLDINFDDLCRICAGQLMSNFDAPNV